MFFATEKVYAETVKELTSMLFWKGVLAEMVGTGLLVSLGCGSCLSAGWELNASITVQVAFTFGFAVATVIKCTEHISGGHVNPAVSFAMFMARRITLIRLIFYVAFQMLGAVFGALFLKLVTPALYGGDICQTSLAKSLTPMDGVLVEALITFALLFNVFACTDPNRPKPGGSISLSIGLTIVLAHLFAIQYTGSSANPARTFGSAVAGGTWTNHWIYWVGPMMGGWGAAFIYDFFLATNANVYKFKHFLTDAYYKPDDFYDDKEMLVNEMERQESTDI